MVTTHPDLAAQLIDTDPTTVVAGTNRRLRWRCALGHEWTAPGSTRVRGDDCPYCSNKRLLVGFNDMATTHPELAAQLVATNPTTWVAGTRRTLHWKCAIRHEWVAPGYDRATGGGCPYCSNKRLLVGFNDMATTHPELAAELVGTDPATVIAGTNKVMSWRCRAHGHEWRTSGNKRASGGQNCPYCGNQALLPGFNDLSTTHPHLAAELLDADPTTVMAGSETKYLWRCPRGHEWRTSAYGRSKGAGCLYCSNQLVLPGFNDMATTHPHLAAEVAGTDPTTVIAGTHRKLSWHCPNHEELYVATGAAKAQGAGCPYCSNQVLLPGFNDMATTHPHLAAELVGTDPATVFAGTHTRLTWKCGDCDNTWGAAGYSRLSGSGCPNCAPYGFNPSKPAYLYLMGRHGEQQIGITVNIDRRQRQHARHGWTLLDSIGPMPGEVAYRLESQLKLWLRDNIGTLPGTTENWSTAHLEVPDLRGLLHGAGLEMPFKSECPN
jgi:DNA-directed RNA polymerase subunit RPC12/RpoP